MAQLLRVVGNPSIAAFTDRTSSSDLNHVGGGASRWYCVLMEACATGSLTDLAVLSAPSASANNIRYVLTTEAGARVALSAATDNNVDGLKSAAISPLTLSTLGERFKLWIGNDGGGGNNYTPIYGNPSLPGVPFDNSGNSFASPATQFDEDDIATYLSFYATGTGTEDSGTPASGDGATATTSAAAASASGSRAVTVTLETLAHTPLNAVERRFWTRQTINGAAIDGGSSGLAVTCNSSGVFALTGLSVPAGAGFLSWAAPGDAMTHHTVPVTFV